MAVVALRFSILHSPQVREAVQRVIEEVLRPLLERDGSSIELLELGEEELVVSVTGSAASGAGAEYVREGIVEPALRSVLGDGPRIRIEKTITVGRRIES